MECKTLVLNMSIYHGSNVKFSVSRYICKWNFSHVVEELCTKFDTSIDNNHSIDTLGVFAAVWISFLIFFITWDISNYLTQNQRMSCIGKSWNDQQYECDDCYELCETRASPHKRCSKLKEISKAICFIHTFSFPITFLLLISRSFPILERLMLLNSHQLIWS